MLCIRRGGPESGTEAGISVVIAVLNIVLKLFVQILAAYEMQWTRSDTVRPKGRMVDRAVLF